MTDGARSRLEAVLRAGEFAVTVEVGPPRGPDPAPLVEKAALLAGLADGYNVTDNQTAVVRMSSIAASAVLLREGLEPVMQMVCRDRNRIAMQSDMLGAAALGIRNCLCLSGDHQRAGAGGKLKGHPGAKNVFDVDSVQLVGILRSLRDDSRQDGGDSITAPAPLFIGAAWTPLAPPLPYRPARLAKKVEAGADFIQTQAVYDVKGFAEQMARAEDMGLTERTAVLAGIIVPTGAGMLRYMHRNVPGVVVPEELVSRMKGASDRIAEGRAVAVELVEAVRGIPGVKGVHLQAIEAEHLLPDVIREAGLAPRPDAGAGDG
jgi:methylenetetrahydrofolate reductase (NADPH)